MTRDQRRRLFDAILDGAIQRPGALDPSIRRAAAAAQPLPAPLAALVEKIRAGAADVTDADVADAQAAGQSDDALFEITVATALGESRRRLVAIRRALGKDY